MERDFAPEIVKSFGTRLKRVYQLEEAALPAQIAVWLEHLKRAEQELAESSRQEPEASNTR
ncbi:MAG TPA: hypothetical protein VEA77_07570 [Hyphomicrobium sp.]|nr:hypothetical protein [Hyphomicrobium sp.]